MVGHRLIRFDSRFCSSTRGRVAARQSTSPSPSGRGNEGSKRSSSTPTRRWRHWSPTPSQRGADALGIAGGDGSLAVVAAAAGLTCCHSCASPLARAITSRSTSASIGSDLFGALDAFTDGVERRIDVAEANGRLFLNNVSLGIYGDAVQQPGYRDAKLRTLLETAHAVLGPSRAAPQLHIVDDLGRDHTTLRSSSSPTTPTRLIGRS